LSASPVRRPERPTRSFSSEQAERAWHVVDATDQILGRLAAQVAHVLRGKHKPTFTPHADGGDFVIVTHARQIRLTGRKREAKRYYRHTGYMGGLKEVTAARLLEVDPARVIQEAVRGMLPRGPLGRRMLTKLKVYPDGEHPHAAQKPQPLELGR
jgi:large subunit ribosomal protein L13